MANLNDDSPMPWGIHRGKAMANVPADYLLWAYENEKCDRPVKDYVSYNLDVIKQQAADIKKRRRYD
jgi:hypothetical protein